MATTRKPRRRPYEVVLEGIPRQPMACFDVLIELGDPQGTRFEPLEALVDTGTHYTTVPAAILRGLGVTPHTRRSFELADDRLVEYDVGETMIRLAGETQHTLVVFNETGTTPLLGTLTLEEFGLWVDPVNERLIKAPPRGRGPFPHPGR